MTDTYKLVSSDVPGRRRSSLYVDMLREFRESGEESVQVLTEELKTATLRQGLRKAVKDEATDDVRMMQRGKETYLVRGTMK